MKPKQTRWVAIERPSSFECPQCGERRIDCRTVDGHFIPRCHACGMHYMLEVVSDSDGEAERDVLSTIIGHQAAEIAALSTRLIDKGDEIVIRKCVHPALTPRPDVSGDKPPATCETLAGTGGQAEHDAKTTADLEAEVETLSETIVKQAKWLRERDPTPAPPADSREAFEEWVKTTDYHSDRLSSSYAVRDTRAAYFAWLAALEWRSRTPASEVPDIAEAKGSSIQFRGKQVGWPMVGPVTAAGVAAEANTANRKAIEEAGR